MTRRASLFAGVILALAFVFLSAPFWSHPIDTWEWLNFAASQEVARLGVPATGPLHDADSMLLLHPPLWAYVAGIGAKVMPGNVLPVRVMGTLAGLATLFLLWGFGRLFFAPFTDENHKAAGAALLSAAIALTNPAFIQGTLYISFCEGTFLPLIFILLVWAWLKFPSGTTLSWRPVLVLGAVLAAAFWTKITTPLILPIGMGVAVLLRHRIPWAPGGNGTGGRNLLKGLLYVLLVALSGGVIFILSWIFYAYRLSEATALPFGRLTLMPFEYLLGQGQGGASAFLSREGLSTSLTTFARTVLYFGPPLCLMAAAEVGIRLRELFTENRSDDRDLVYILAVGVTAAYLVLQGGSGSFPKYHLAILPFLALLAGRYILRFARGYDRTALFAAVLYAAVGVFYYAFAVGDYLLDFNYVMRRDVVAGIGALPALTGLGFKMALGALFPLAAYGALRAVKVNAPWGAIFAATLVSAQLGLVAAQARGDYFLFHSYGSALRDMDDLIAIVRAETPEGSPIMALPEIGYLTDRPTVKDLRRYSWDDAPALAAMIEKDEPSAVVYGFPLNTIGQMKHVFSDPRFIDALRKNGYSRKAAGDYSVWLDGGVEGAPK